MRLRRIGRINDRNSSPIGVQKVVYVLFIGVEFRSNSGKRPGFARCTLESHNRCGHLSFESFVPDTEVVLVIREAVAEDLGGTVSIESLQGGGAEATLSLPIDGEAET